MSVTFNHTGITVKDLDHSEAMFRDLLALKQFRELRVTRKLSLKSLVLKAPR
ncbi:hypothetical protein HGG76_19915 [Ochrobactrum tritici]|uniref:Lactoylglutathione lyase n=1 Tax=Brucella tritici TaxID=94626 RepID=A0A7X6FRX0_9HYPH|nr:hypothetical protein [Brucella tritici]